MWPQAPPVHHREDAPLRRVKSADNIVTHNNTTTTQVPLAFRKRRHGGSSSASTNKRPRRATWHGHAVNYCSNNAPSVSAAVGIKVRLPTQAIAAITASTSGMMPTRVRSDFRPLYTYAHACAHKQARLPWGSTRRFDVARPAALHQERGFEFGNVAV